MCESSPVSSMNSFTAHILHGRNSHLMQYNKSLKIQELTFTQKGMAQSV